MEKYNIDVKALATYLADQSDEDASRYVFAYTITITNKGSVSAQLISRHWVITDADNETQEVRGLGVIGEQPKLKPGESYEYSSGSALGGRRHQVRCADSGIYPQHSARPALNFYFNS
jgi:ApaG protein